ncbi:MAG: GNAT family N-acetyltransferase [Alphaproteobacteria bacterium]|nr:GNAT family N-acetyltransferase [Alphaproteobacteria bacterium]
MESLLLSGHKTQPDQIRLLDRMYKLRHTVFAERLKWTSLNNAQREIDLYDVINPVYLICRDTAGEVVGCWRLLPTTGPYMLKDIFPHLLWGAPAPEQSDIWEISRFAIDPQWRDYDSLGAVGSVVGQMLLDLFDFSQSNGITRIVAASDIRFDRILRRAGLTTTHYGPAVRMENSYAVAGWAEITMENRETIERRLAGTHVASIPAAIASDPLLEMEKLING